MSDSPHNLFSFGRHKVPGIWRFLLPPEAQNLTPPLETGATCANCPRIHTEKYRPDYRCCTYFPRVPNFLIGLALQNNVTLAPLFDRLLQDGWLLPEGFQASPQRSLLIAKDVKNKAFGKSTSVLCPFLDGASGLCQIYGYRNASCSTFFCTHDHERKGHTFWESVADTVTQSENAIAQWALNEVGFNLPAYWEKLNGLAAQMESCSDPKTQGFVSGVLDLLWGEYRGRERELYLGVASVVTKNRANLWEITNTVAIGEAKEWEIAATHFPDKAPEETSEDGDPFRPSELWEKIRRTHTTLWRLPAGKYVLNPNVRIEQNFGQSALDKANAHLSHVVSLSGKSKFGLRSVYTSATEIEVLNAFRQPKDLKDPEVGQMLDRQGIDERYFLSAWVARRVLVQDLRPLDSRTGRRVRHGVEKDLMTTRQKP